MNRLSALICALLLVSGCATTRGVNAIPPTTAGDGLRASYEACLGAAGGVVFASQGCIEAEDRYQRGLLVEAGRLLRAGNDDVAFRVYETDKQQWDAITAVECRWDA